MTDARVSAVLAGVDAEARWRIGVVAKRTYIVHAGQTIESQDQVALVDAPLLADDGLQLVHDADVMLRKPMVDVVVQGHVYAHENNRRCNVSIRVGGLRRVLAVTGDRRLERDRSGHARFTPPEPFERISLGWERAYGGHDAAALAAYGDPTEKLRREAGIDSGPIFGLYAYPRNPAGRGYLVELSDDALARCELPNLEDPSAMLTPDRMVYGNSLAWPGGPPPASTSWLPYSFFPRLTLLGFPPPMFDAEAFPAQGFHEVCADLLPARSLAEGINVSTLHDLRCAQGSAPGMRVAQVCAGDLVELSNVHPNLASWRFPLPSRPPKMLIRIGIEAPRELVPMVRTVLLEPDLDRLCLVWVGEMVIDMPLTPMQLSNVQHAVLWN